MKMLNVLGAGVLACVLLVPVGGCNRGPSLSEIEAKERTSRLFRDAMDDLQAGRMDAAIKRFERVVQEEPKAYSAHFQLATLLQDVRKDYISAIAHYRDYLAMRPASDKATVAQDRVKLCETLLSAEMVRKAGGSASNKLSEDNDRLTAQCDALQKKVSGLEGELEKAKRTIARLETENASKSRLLDKLGAAVEEGKGAAKNPSLKQALAELKAEKDEVVRRRLNPSEAELLDEEDEPSVPSAPSVKGAAVDLKAAKALALDAEGETPPPPSSAKPAAAQNPAVGAKPTTGKPGSAAKAGGVDALLAGKKSKPSEGARPETYTVQEGDTLFKIAKRFYGSSHKYRDIQNANRAIVPADGRVRAGQVLKLP